MDAQKNVVDSSRHIIIFDTTLRDGEQSPGASMNLVEKREVALALEELGVDVIEAGFPIVSPDDFEAVREIAGLVKNSTVCGLARCREQDIDRAWEALKGAADPRIHVFLATSAVHREFKLRMTQEEIIARAVEGVKRAKGYCSNIEFSPEDACRTEIDFLCKVVEATIDAGATTINIPDTVGYTTPVEMTKRIKTLFNRVPNIDKAIISIHCHNDLGLAVANSLAAVVAGAGQIECAVNGLGERAGNCALEEVVMALRVRSDALQDPEKPERLSTRIDTTKLVRTSRIVSKNTGLSVSRNKAIVGRNAFAHEAGIHQDGVLKERTTYEIMRPEDVGFSQNDLVLGKHSGRAALSDRIRKLRFKIEDGAIDPIFTQFKILADKKKEVNDGDICELVYQQTHCATSNVGDWKSESYALSGSGEGACVDVVLSQNGVEKIAKSKVVNGPVHAIFEAVKQIVGLEGDAVSLNEFKIEAIPGGGSDAQGRAVVTLRYKERPDQQFRGQGTSTDVLKAVLDAFVDAVDRILHMRLAPLTDVKVKV